MKGTFRLLAAATTLMFATACQKDDSTFGSAETGAPRTVRFVASIPEGMNTKAYSDGTKATKLLYAAYEVTTSNNSTSSSTSGIETLSSDYICALKGEANMENLTATLELDLTDGKTYKVVFWASTPNNKYYTFNVDSGFVSVNYEAANCLSNTEDRDAFYAMESLTVDGATDRTIVLKRPFAQLNIGSYIPENNGFTPTQSEVKVPVYSKLDMLDGSVSGLSTVTFNYNALPTGDFPVSGYNYIAMNYLLTGSNKSIHDVEINIKGSQSNHIVEQKFTNVPFQRNYRTNIYGSILSKKNVYTVVIEPSYNGDLVNTDLAYFLRHGGTLDLTDDIVLDNYITFPAGLTGKINLNGHRISLSKNAYSADDPTSMGCPIYVYGNLEIEGNGVITAGSAQYLNPCIYVYGGSLTINGGKYEGGVYVNSQKVSSVSPCIFAAGGGTVTINSGLFVSLEESEETNYLLAQDSNERQITVYGGSFANYNPANGYANESGIKASFMPEGYSSVITGKYYTSAGKAEDLYTVGKIVSKESELASASGTVLVNGTISLSNALTISKDITIVGMTKESKITGNELILTGEDVALMNMTIDNAGANEDCCISFTDNTNAQNISIQGCKIINSNGEGIVVTNTNLRSLYLIDCDFDDERTENGSPYIKIDSDVELSDATLSITGCTFEDNKNENNAIIYVRGIWLNNMTISNNKVKGQYAQTYSTDKYHIQDGLDSTVMSLDKIKQYFVYTEN